MSHAAQPPEQPDNPWPALWAMVIGFFMILMDSSIVNVANPALMKGFDATYAGVIWATSSYLLAYAVPLLVTGRLGDRFGSRRIYLTGLTIFTLSSLACALAPSLGVLIGARAVQGLGASLMTPQTMAVITRTFPPHRRGEAMGVWGAVAGIAMLVGPILGGILVDTLGWRWIFLVNVPIGLVAWILAYRRVPRLVTHPHRFDLLGVLLSTLGMFGIVFGLQEFNTFHGGPIVGPIAVWMIIAGGVAALGLFLLWQARNPGEPLLPLGLLRNRNFAVANTAISMAAFAVQCFPLPLMFYLQQVRGLTPTLAALLLAPSAIVSAALARPVGRLVDRVANPRRIVAPGLAIAALGVAGYALLVRGDVPVAWLIIPNALLGVGMSATWGPVSTAANRTLPPRYAGAGAGVYNATRQVGAVLGSASVAALIEWRTAVHAPDAAGSAAAMGDVLWLPAAAFAGAVVVAWFFEANLRRPEQAQSR